ncbi:MAG: hypothetical protein KDA29_00915 [Phycisphaerales bacterium]|nr:hypothetical protein [Phycisphaerales bacterium]
MMKIQATGLIAVFVCGTASAGLADFYVAGADGRIYSVSGASLTANEIYQVQGGLAINDIIFTGGNKMLANVTDQLIEYNMSTGTETVIFDVNDLEGEDEFYFSSGFAGTHRGDIFMSIRRIGPTVNDYIGATYDPFSGDFTELADIQSGVGGLYFDHQEIAPNRFLGADFENDSIRVFNSASGMEIASYDIGFGPVSFLELASGIFVLDRDGGLHSFDADNGATSYYGSITGFSGDLLGAASTEIFRVPAPGTGLLMGFAGLIAVRRRR